MTRPLWPTDPRRLGDYELLGRLGEGGTGAVFLGRAPDGRLVAVKVIRSEYAWDQEFRGLFRSEVNRAREVPKVIDFGIARALEATSRHTRTDQMVGTAPTTGGPSSLPAASTRPRAPNACAVIWFRVVDRSGYRASFCPAEIRLGLDDQGDVTGERKVASTGFQPGQTHRVAIAVRNETAQVTVDGTAVLSLPLTDPLLAGGKVEFGAVPDPKGLAAVTTSDGEATKLAEMNTP